MNIKTNQPQFKAFCDDLQLPCELLAPGDFEFVADEQDTEPFIFIEGKLVTKIIDLTKSPKFLMMKKILG